MATYVSMFTLYRLECEDEIVLAVSEALAQHVDRFNRPTESLEWLGVQGDV